MPRSALQEERGMLAEQPVVLEQEPVSGIRIDDELGIGQALRIREQYLGPEHLETAHVLYDFADFQQAQGQNQEAAFLYQRALTIREHVLGADSPLTIDTRERLHAVLVALGQSQGVTAQSKAIRAQTGRKNQRTHHPSDQPENKNISGCER